MNLEREMLLKEFTKSIDVSKAILSTELEESDCIEFKKSLHVVSETIDKAYLSTIAAFANNKGGVIIFGIDPVTKELVGIKEEFENLDNRYFSSTIRISLDGSLEYAFFTHRYLQKLIGFLTVREATTKPIICKVDAKDIKLGDIYFRYPAQTARIGAGELRKLIFEEINQKAQNLVQSFQSIIDAGVENIAILNTQTGEIQSGVQDLKLVLNENILNKLNLIRKGEIVSEKGAPAYIIKGEIEVENTTYVEVNKPVPYIISEAEVLQAFLNGECDYPEVMIKQILCFHRKYNPIHFFVKSAGMTSEEGIEFIQNIEDSSVTDLTRNRIIERLGDYKYDKMGKLNIGITELIDDKFSIEENVNQLKQKYTSLIRNNEIQAQRKLFYNTMLQLIPISKETYAQCIQRAIESIFHIDKNLIIANEFYFKTELKKISETPMDSSALSIFKRVICLIDDFLYRN